MNARPQHCWCPLNTVSFIFKFDVIKKKNESEINICVKKMAIFSHQLFFWSTCQNRAAENCCVAPQAIQGMWCSNPDVLLSLLFPTFKIYRFWRAMLRSKWSLFDKLHAPLRPCCTLYAVGWPGGRGARGCDFLYILLIFGTFSNLRKEARERFLKKA